MNTASDVICVLIVAGPVFVLTDVNALDVRIVAVNISVSTRESDTSAKSAAVIKYANTAGNAECARTAAVVRFVSTNECDHVVGIVTEVLSVSIKEFAQGAADVVRRALISKLKKAQRKEDTHSNCPSKNINGLSRIRVCIAVSLLRR